MAVIGLDVGTSGVKSTVFGDDAKVIAHAYREYNLISSGDGQYELDPKILLSSAIEVISESTKKAGLAVDAISVTSFGESFVCLDQDKNVLSNTMIYMDRRGTQECEEFLEKYDEAAFFARSGHYVDPMFGAYKMRWMNKNRPDIMQKTCHICFIADFMTYMFGAEAKCDYSLAARSAMFDVFEKKWIPEMIEFAGVSPEALPTAVPGGSVVGYVSEEMAGKLGVSTSTKLILGGHDQVTAALGSGAWEAGDVANGMGTTDCITAVMSREGMDMENMLKYRFTAVPFLDSGLYVTYAFNMSGGCTLKWFRDTLSKDIASLDNAYTLLNEEAPKEPTDIYVLPYLAGGGTPYMDGDTPASIVGLKLSTTRGQLFRAFMEGETYEMMLNIECLKNCGVEVGKIITVGGGTNSPLWMQIRSDVFGRDLYLLVNKEAGTLATALLGYVGMGVFPSIRDAQQHMISFAGHYAPDAEKHALYSKKYLHYKMLYEQTKAYWKQRPVED